MKKATRFTLIAFEHPDNEKSLAYRQNLSEEQLLRAISTAIANGANLFSIRGFKND